MSVAPTAVKPLPKYAAEVDAELTRMDEQIDWLYFLSPLHNDAMWKSFTDSHYRHAPRLQYPDIPASLAGLRQTLRQLPVEKVELPLVRALLLEKQRELERQLELILMRETEGFVAVSLELFGGADPSLSKVARTILQTVHSQDDPEESAGCEDMVAAAQLELESYRKIAPELKATVKVLDDLSSMMMVHLGHFEVARSVRLAPARIQPLIAHEVGTHVLTRFNGQQQSLKQLEVGLAHYDALQEGLGTLAEYLAGYLPARRLRVIAARVIASDLAVERRGLLEIFSILHEEHGLPESDAFDVAVRACRGGGLTKDSVYLKGLRDLLVYLADGGDLTFLHLGKFALEQRLIIKELLEEGWVVPPRLIPRHLETEQGRARLKRLRSLPIESLYQRSPEPCD